MAYCLALSCENATGGPRQNSSVTCYGFPSRNKPLLRQWIHNVGWDMGTPSAHQRLCSKRFEDNSFKTDPLKIGNPIYLLREAVPQKFVLGKDGNWLVGTPQIIRVEGPWTFGNAGARERKDLEDRQKELSIRLIKENYEFLTGLDYPVPKSSIQPREVLRVKDQQGFEEREIPARLGAGCGGGAAIGSELWSHPKSAETTRLHQSSSGASRGLTPQIPDRAGVTSESHWDSAADQANPTGSRRGTSSPEEGERQEFQEMLFYQQTQTGERLYLCTECRKTFKLKIGLRKHRQIHARKSQVPSYICTDCGRSFDGYADVIRHRRAHREEPLPGPGM